MFMKIISDRSEINFDNLEQFVYHHPHGNFFQSTKAYEFFQSVENYEPVLLVAKKGNEMVGSLLAALMKEKGIKGYFSRRCIVWGGPLVKEDNPHIAHGLLDKLNQIVSSKTIYTEFRNLYDICWAQASFLENGFQFNDHLNYLVKVDSLENAKRKLSKSKLRQINQSLKLGASIIEPRNLEDVRNFYHILVKLYKEKVKKSLPVFNFFEKFYTGVSLGKYFLIEQNNRIVGGILCPIYKDTIYEWFVCGKDGDIKNVYPSVLATWAPIEYAARNGLTYFDFMGAGKPDADYGVREFKSKFGGELVNYGRFLRINKPVLYFIGKVGVKVLGWVGSVF